MTVTPFQISFLNYLGGFDHFFFTAKKEYQVLIEEQGQTKTNLLPQWPYSYGYNANTIDKETYRISRQAVIVRSQYLSLAQLEALQYIKISPLVQIVYSRNSARTVLVDTDSFVKYDEKDKLFSIQFKISFTDVNPSQRV